MSTKFQAKYCRKANDQRQLSDFRAKERENYGNLILEKKSPARHKRAGRRVPFFGAPSSCKGGKPKGQSLLLSLFQFGDFPAMLGYRSMEYGIFILQLFGLGFRR